MAQFNLEDYETVEQRLERFWKDHPAGRILTDIEHRDERSFIVKAAIHFSLDDVLPISTGYAEEIIGQGPVNKTSALENCETSAIGRALANCNYSGAKNRPSREEMEKVARGAVKAPVSPVEVIKPATQPVTPVEPQTASDDVLRVAHAIIGGASTLDTLRKVWADNKNWLDQQFDVTQDGVEGIRTTLAIEINDKKKEIEGGK